MGLPFGRYVCSQCGVTHPTGIRSSQRRYELDDGTLVDMHTAVAWCIDCETLRAVEDLSLKRPLEALRRAAAALMSVTERNGWFRTAWSCISFHPLDRRDTTVELTKESHHALGRVVDEAQRHIAYLGTRTAPARCLGCGGQRVLDSEAVDADGNKGYLHPGCGGVLHLELTGSMNLHPLSTYKVHGPDGAYLRDEPLAP